MRVDSSGCLSSGRCIASAPAAFAFDADRLSHATGAELPLDDALAIARGCPALVIDVLGDDGEPLEL